MAAWTVAAADSVVVLEARTLMVDRTSNTASGLLWLRNNAKEPAKVKLSLSAGDFVIGKKRGLGAKTVFSAPGVSPGKSVYELEILAETNAPVDVTVTNLWEAGESEADLLSNGNKIGTLKALKDPVPFNVKLSSATSDTPNVSFLDGIVERLIIKNDDPMTYPVSWEIAIAGISAKPLVGSSVVLPPSGTARLDINPPKEWFKSGTRGFFRDEVRDAILTLRYTPQSTRDDPHVVNKPIPLKAHLSSWPPSAQSAFSNFLILVMLLAGGICSLTISQWVPNRLRRHDLKEQLGLLALKIRNLSTHIDSSLRVLARVQRLRLYSLLHSRWIMSPDMATVFTQCSQGLGTLNKQVDLLDAIDTASDRLVQLRSAPPTLRDEIEANLREAASRLDTATVQEADLQAAQSLISSATNRISTIGKSDTGFAAKLADKVKNLRPLFSTQPPGRIGGTAKCQLIKTQLPGPFGILEAQLEDPTNILANGYEEIDTKLSKLELIRDYVTVYEGTADPETRRGMEGHEVELLNFLGQDSWTSLKLARTLVSQMREGVFGEHIQTAIKANQLKITLEPPVGRANWPMQLNVEFASPQLNGATAKDNFQCNWRFGHDELTERGWMVYHYFPQEIMYLVKADFAGPDGQSLTDDHGVAIQPLERQFTVQPDESAKPRDRFWTELIRLSIVLVVALFALMAGAREQLLKLDLIPGMIAIFAIGFGADTIKNLLAPPAKVS